MCDIHKSDRTKRQLRSIRLWEKYKRERTQSYWSPRLLYHQVKGSHKGFDHLFYSVWNLRIVSVFFDDLLYCVRFFSSSCQLHTYQCLIWLKNSDSINEVFFCLLNANTFFKNILFTGCNVQTLIKIFSFFFFSSLSVSFLAFCLFSLFHEEPDSSRHEKRFYNFSLFFFSSLTSFYFSLFFSSSSSLCT